MALASLTLRPIGFSTSTGLPASAAATVYSSCVFGGEATYTASISGVRDDLIGVTSGERYVVRRRVRTISAEAPSLETTVLYVAAFRVEESGSTLALDDVATSDNAPADRPSRTAHRQPPLGSRRRVNGIGLLNPGPGFTGHDVFALNPPDNKAASPGRSSSTDGPFTSLVRSSGGRKTLVTAGEPAHMPGKYYEGFEVGETIEHPVLELSPRPTTSASAT